MLVFELTYPGTWLELEDKEAARDVQVLLYLIESQLSEAAIALNLFEASRTARRPSSMEEWEADSAREAELLAQLEISTSDLASSSSPEVLLNLHLQAAMQLKREKWRSGRLPREYDHAIPFIYARAFLYAIDAIRKLFDVLADRRDLPPAVRAERDAFHAALPQLRGVRDSAQHLEDRGRGLGKGNRPLTLKPVENTLVSAPAGGALILSSLNGNRLGYTMDDGHYGEVEVSAATLGTVRDRIQGILDVLSWSGPQHHYPS